MQIPTPETGLTDLISRRYVVSYQEFIYHVARLLNLHLITMILQHLVYKSESKETCLIISWATAGLASVKKAGLKRASA